MICRSCGTEIADKALVCYRCGTATATPTSPEEPRRSPSASRLIGPSVAALLLLLVVALFMGTAASGQVPRIAGWIVAGAAALVVAWRLLIRRGGT